MKVDFLIVGSGLFGSVFAEQCRRHKKTCLVLEKNQRVGGHVWSEKMVGIDVHTTGPHIFHTDSEEIWNYVNQFSPFNSYRHRVVAKSEGFSYSFPINWITLDQTIGLSGWKAHKEWQKTKNSKDFEKNFETWCLYHVGEALYEVLYKGYTTKQWGLDPKELPASIAKRIPIRESYNDYYHTSRFSGVPIWGYDIFMQNLIRGTKVELSTNFFARNSLTPSFYSIRDQWRLYAHRLVYTGPIDQYYDYCFGKLGYRSILNAHAIHHSSHSIQGIAQVNYTGLDQHHTRTIEHKYFVPESAAFSDTRTVVTAEIPVEWKDDSMERYYPIKTHPNSEMYRKYRELQYNQKDVIFGGRLADYCYRDMAPTIQAAMAAFKRAVE